MTARRTQPKKSSPSRTIRCAIYTRKSSEEGLRQEFNSLDAQRAAGEAYVLSHKTEGWECLATRYDDGGHSGGTLERPALQRLLADIEAGQIDIVIVYKIDRLSRSLADFVKMMSVFDEHGVACVSVTQAFDTSTSMGRLTLNVLLSFAQFEREVIGERIRDKVAASRQRGKWTGGTPVLGYDVDRSGPSPKLVANPVEAARVREIFDLYLERGALLPVVAELQLRGWVNKAWMTRHGRNRGGLAFDKCRLHALLTNVLYIGKIRHKENVYPGEHEAIVEGSVFARVQRQLKQNGQRGNPDLRNKHGALLRGLLFCKSCDRAMSHTFTTRGNVRYRYYACTKALKNGRAACPTPSLPAVAIEKAVVDQIRCIADDVEVRKNTLKQARAQSESAVGRLITEQRGLQRELERLRRGVVKAATKVEGNDSSQLAELARQIETAETRLAEVTTSIGHHEAESLTDSDVSAAFSDFSNVWSALTPREQAQVIRLLVSRVEFDVTDSAIEVTFHATGIKAIADKRRAHSEEAA